MSAVKLVRGPEESPKRSGPRALTEDYGSQALKSRLTNAHFYQKIPACYLIPPTNEKANPFSKPKPHVMVADAPGDAKAFHPFDFSLEGIRMNTTAHLEPNAPKGPVLMTAPTRTEDAVRYLVIHSPDGVAHSFELRANQTYRLGRSDANDLTLKDMQVSSFHARLEPDGDDFILRDLESRNGTMVNGERIHTRHLHLADRLRLGQTEIDYVKRLDPSELGTAAILSPRLSQPLLRTEVQRMRDLIDELATVQQTLELRAPNDTMRQLGHELARVSADLWNVENHLRSLICANHFHQLFQSQSSTAELYHDMLRYIASAVDAENACFVLLENSKVSVAATIGISTLNWTFRIPPLFQFIIGRAMHEATRYYSPSLGSEELLTGKFPKELSISDRRSVLVVPIVTPETHQVLGAAYFDNVHHPRQLRPQSSEMAEGCLAIYANYRKRHEVAGTQRRSRSEIAGIQAANAASERCEPTVFEG